MARVKIAAVGKLKEQYWRDAAAEYLKRLSRFCKAEIVEVEEGKGDFAHAIAKESRALQSKTEGAVWLCDLSGESVSSERFEQLLEKDLAAYGTITFLVGGSDGVDDELKRTALRRIRFGEQTLPHQLARIVLLEQLYRAFTILNRVPYHK